jgi:hypothetical protein
LLGQSPEIPALKYNFPFTISGEKIVAFSVPFDDVLICIPLNRNAG